MKTLKELVDSSPDFARLMQEKSISILEADSLRDRGKQDAAMRMYETAAELESRVYSSLEHHGLRGPALDSLVSCASCWYAAGKLEAARKLVLDALELCAGDAETRSLCLTFLRRIEKRLSYSKGLAQTQETP